MHRRYGSHPLDESIIFCCHFLKATGDEQAGCELYCKYFNSYSLHLLYTTCNHHCPTTSSSHHHTRSHTTIIAGTAQSRHQHYHVITTITPLSHHQHYHRYLIITPQARTMRFAPTTSVIMLSFIYWLVVFFFKCNSIKMYVDVSY